MYDVLKPNMYYTAIPAPFFPELDSLMKETGGFNMDSCNISKNVDDTLKKWPLAKEQAGTKVAIVIRFIFPASKFRLACPPKNEAAFNETDQFIDFHKQSVLW